MSRRAAPAFHYVAVSLSEREHVVFVVHDETPDWWKRVATFGNKARADDYASMENDLTADWDEPLAGREGDDTPAPQMAEPMSSLKPGELVRRSTLVEHTRIAHQEVVERAPEKAVHSNLLPKNEVVAGALDGEIIESDDEPTELRPAHGLAPLTEQQLRVFTAIRAADGGVQTYLDLARATGVKEGSLPSAVYALMNKGYVRARHLGGNKKAYDVIAEGAPVCMDHKLDAAPTPPPKPAPRSAPPKVETRVSFPVVRRVEEPKKSDRDLINDHIAKHGVRRFDTADSGMSFNVQEYLTKKGHEVKAKGWGAAWHVDGKRMEYREVIALVNTHRAKADLPPLSVGTAA